MRGLVAVALLALVVPLSGCFSFCEAPPPVSARAVPDNAPSAAGDGPAGVAVVVREEGASGKPIAGAGVVFFWGDESNREAGGLVQIGPGGVLITGSADIRPPRYSATLELRTDAEGRAFGRLPANRIAGVVVAAPGYTEETVRAFATGAVGNRSLLVPLFHDRLTQEFDGTIMPGGLSTAVVPAVGSAVWYPDASAFTPDYLDRLVRLRVVLNWTNGPTAFADLAVGVGLQEDLLARYEDSDTEALPGDYSQPLVMGLGELDELDIVGAEQLLAGPASLTGYLAPFGLAYTLTVEGDFETRSAFESQCGPDFDNGRDVTRASPLPAAVWLTLSLLMLAAVSRRR